MNEKPYIIDLPQTDLEALGVSHYQSLTCWSAGCEKPPEYVLRTLYNDPQPLLRFVHEVPYCWNCMGWFADNFKRYPGEYFPLGYYALAKAAPDEEGDAW